MKHRYLKSSRLWLLLAALWLFWPSLSASAQQIPDAERERTYLLKTRNWVEFADPSHNFQVLLPTLPETQEAKVPASKTVSLVQQTYRALDRDGKAIYVIIGLRMPDPGAKAPGRVVIKRNDYDKLMFVLREKFLSGLRSGNNACNLEDAREVLSGVHRGREYSIKGEGCISGKVRLYATPRQMFMVGVIGSEGERGFMDSFLLTRTDERFIVE